METFRKKKLRRKKKFPLLKCKHKDMISICLLKDKYIVFISHEQLPPKMISLLFQQVLGCPAGC